jgi:hypothetical protein
MTRPTRMPGEKPLLWTGSSKEDLMGFPEAVIDKNTGLPAAFRRQVSPHHSLTDLVRLVTFRNQR